MTKSNLIGKHIIVRSNMAGVFFGILTNKEGKEVTLQNARKFYYFSGANTVEDLAVHGAQNKDNCKLTEQVDEVVISEFEQMLPCTEKSVQQNQSIKPWTYNN